MWGYFLFPHSGKEHYGHFDNFENTIKQRCVEDTCGFCHYGGMDSTFQCPEMAQGGGMDDHDPLSSFEHYSLEVSYQTDSYECVADRYDLDLWRGYVKAEATDNATGS